MMGCLLLRAETDWPKRILQVGLGAASLTKFWHRYRPDAHQTILEINPDVLAMAYASFQSCRTIRRALRFTSRTRLCGWPKRAARNSIT